TGKSAGDARLLTATPLDIGKQHVLRELCKSSELIDKPVDARNPSRRQTVWVQRPGVADGPIRAHYEFYCTPSTSRPTTAMTELAKSLYAGPQPGQDLQSEAAIQSDDADITTLAQRLTTGLNSQQDQAAALFRHVAKQIDNEPTVSGPSVSAIDCLKTESGDSRAKSRLLAALCRNRGIPARLVTGLALARGQEQTAHVWVEAWLNDHWLPMCPFAHFYGHVPPTYLIFGF